MWIIQTRARLSVITSIVYHRSIHHHLLVVTEKSCVVTVYNGFSCLMIWLFIYHWGDNLFDTKENKFDLWTRFHFSRYPQWLVSSGWLPSGSLSLPAGLGPASGLDMPGTALALATSLSRQLVDIRTHLWSQPHTSPVSCELPRGCWNAQDAEEVEIRKSEEKLSLFY